MHSGGQFRSPDNLYHSQKVLSQREYEFRCIASWKNWAEIKNLVGAGVCLQCSPFPVQLLMAVLSLSVCSWPKSWRPFHVRSFSSLGMGPVFTVSQQQTDFCQAHDHTFKYFYATVVHNTYTRDCCSTLSSLSQFLEERMVLQLDPLAGFWAIQLLFLPFP